MKPATMDIAEIGGAPATQPKKPAAILPARIKKAINWLSSPALVFFTLPFLMFLLVTGTIAQRYIGLYDAQNIYFSSFIAWLGPVPLPGSYSLIALITLSLLVKFLFKSIWVWRKTGINLAHLGVLVLLCGGLVTAFHSEEGFIVIPEGQSSAFISDYHQREMLIVKDDVIVGKIPHQDIRTGKTIGHEKLPFSIEILESCRNCEIIKREDSSQNYEAPLSGMAQFMALMPAKPESEDEVNLYGATLAIDGATQIIFEAMPKPIAIEKDGSKYEIIYGKQQRTLPFSLRLENFEQKLHPGTAMASGYSSDIIVEDGAAKWPVTIAMNEPLRYKGYTFFQSSFAQSGKDEATVLTAVKNKGWLFPYIGTAIIAIGLLLHVLLMAFKGRDAQT